MKRTFLAVLASLFVFSAGCVSGGNPQPAQGLALQNGTGQGSFQDEQYIWESWSYGTNRVENVK